MNRFYKFISQLFGKSERLRFLHDEVVRLSNQNGMLAERLQHRDNKIKQLYMDIHDLNRMLDEYEQGNKNN